MSFPNGVVIITVEDSAFPVESSSNVFVDVSSEENQIITITIPADEPFSIFVSNEGPQGPKGDPGTPGAPGDPGTFKVTNVSSNYTVDSDSQADNVLLVDSSGGPLTITLPTTTLGRYLILKDKLGNFFSNNVIVDPLTKKIDNQSGILTLGANHMSIGLVSDGTDWFII